MTKFFLDCDVILDFIAERQPFFQYADKIFQLIDSRQAKAYTSPIVVSNLSYLLTRQKCNINTIKLILLDLINVVQILPVNAEVLAQGLKSDFKNIEDGLQHAIAIKGKCTCIISRNIKDYEKSILPVLSPEAYIKNSELNSSAQSRKSHVNNH